MHRDVRPLTPLLLFVIMKLGGGIGAMHAVMIGLMLVAHTLTFFTLRQWFTERLALLATLATATSWWVYANAFTVMTEPLFLVFFWAAMLTLSGLPGVKLSRQWMRVIAAALLMAGAWENRVAAILLVPGTIIGLWLSHRDVGWKTRAGWVSVFVLVFVLLIWDYKRPMPGAEIAAKNEETYHVNVFVGIKNPLIDVPVSAGRWVTEGLAAATGAPFEMSSKPIRFTAGLAAIVIFIVACIGWVRLWRGGHWYAIGMAFYFLPIVIQWGARIKPRYMTPIAPILFIQLCYGFSCPLPPGTPGGRVRGAFFSGWCRRKEEEPLTLTLPPRSTVGGGDRMLFALLLILNLVPYGVEWYVRHGTSMNFYDVSRRGGYAELVDIGAFVQKHAPGDAEVWVNWPPPSSRPPEATFAPDRRIVQFLTNREVKFMKPAAQGDLEGTLANGPEDHAKLDIFFEQVTGDWAIVYYNRLRWPSYHLPLIGKVTGTRWWRLYRREGITDHFTPVEVPCDREYVRAIPGLVR